MLIGLSAAQAGAGIIGMAVAIRRRHPYGFLMLHGDPGRVARDAIGMGTALSAPGWMLVTQLAATAQLMRTRGRRAERVLGTLGAGMVVGCLGEDLVRRRLRRSGWDTLETPLAAVELGLASAMALVGLTGRGVGSQSFRV